MKAPKTSQQLEIERYEREARKWAKLKARWTAYKTNDHAKPIGVANPFSK
jgi:hypothetical protein